MPFGISPHPMRKAGELTSWAATDHVDIDLPTGGHDSGGDIERQRAGAGRAGQRRRVAADSRRHRFQIERPELVAARSDRGPENRASDRLGKGTDRSSDHAGRQPAPPRMHDSELGFGADQHERCTIADPATQNRAVEIGEGDVTGLPVVGAGSIDPNDRVAMTLIELRPRQIDEAPPPLTRARGTQPWCGGSRLPTGSST